MHLIKLISRNFQVSNKNAGIREINVKQNLKIWNNFWRKHKKLKIDYNNLKLYLNLSWLNIE